MSLELPKKKAADIPLDCLLDGTVRKGVAKLTRDPGVSHFNTIGIA